MHNASKNCPSCGRDIVDERANVDRAGSLTSFLLSDLTCSCRVDAASPAGKRSAKLCPRCNKIIPDVKRQGSLTSFFFKDVRCSCADAGDPTSRSAMQTRFADRSKKVTQKRALQKETAMARTRAVLSKDAAAFVDLSPGQIIGGSYRLLSVAGEGGMGSVYEAQHMGLDRRCAVKFIAPSLVSEATWQLFQKEAKIVSSLTHPTLCQIYDLGIHSGRLPFYVMDLVEGNTLDEVLTRQGPLSVGATAELYVKVLEGLSYAHRKGVVHKDLKPANIMLERQKDQDVQVRILDFGISELSESAISKHGGSQGAIMGSAPYMSPEQFVNRQVEKTADIYSIGCSMFETLTGLPPFPGEDFKSLENAHIRQPAPTLSGATGMFFPPQIEAIVAKCLEKDARLRYQHAGELSIDLQKMLDGKPLQFARAGNKGFESSSGQSGEEKLRSLASLPPAVVIVAVSLVICTVVATLAYFALRERAGDADKSRQSDMQETAQSIQAAGTGAGPIALSEGRIGSMGYVRERYLVLDKVPAKGGQFKRVLEINKAQNYQSIFEELANAKIVGVRVNGSDSADILAQVTKSFPQIEYLAVPDLSSVNAVSVKRFARLKYLEVLTSGGRSVPVTVLDGFDNVLLPGRAYKSLTVSGQGGKAKVKRLVFHGCKFTGEDISEIKARFDFDSILLADCDLDMTVLSTLAQTPDKVDLIVYKRTLKEMGGTPADLELLKAHLNVYLLGELEANSLEASSDVENAVVRADDQAKGDVGASLDTVFVAEGPIEGAVFKARDGSSLADPKNSMEVGPRHRMLVVVHSENLYAVLSAHKVKSITGALLSCHQEARVLKTLHQCYPDITYLKMSALPVEAVPACNEFARLETLEINPDSRKISEVVVARPWKTIVIQSSDKLEFKRYSGSSPKVGELQIYFSTIEPQAIKEIMSAMDVERIIFYHCRFGAGALDAFASSPKTIDVRLLERRSDLPQAQLLIDKVKTGKVKVSVAKG